MAYQFNDKLMSNEDLLAFLRNAAADTRLLFRFRRPVSYEDFQAIARDRGFDLEDLTASQARQMIESDRCQSATAQPVALPEGFYEHWT